MKDYKALIVGVYKLSKSDTTWRPNLSRPTPNSIKEECEIVCQERWSQADVQCLRNFFGPCNDLKTALQAIRQHPTDKFKPIIRFLEGKTKGPADKVTEITAWLLDVKPRPYNSSVDYDKIRKDIIEAGNQILGYEWRHSATPVQADQQSVVADEVGESEVHSVPQQIIAKERNGIFPILRRLYGKPYFKSIAIAVIAFAALATADNWIYGWGDYKDLRNGPAGPQLCMYWADDHYEKVSCNTRFGYDTMVVAFDSVRFHNLKRVTTPDTITLNAIGRLWYIKRNNKYEFFTSNGYYPTDPKHRLRPVTERIIINEIRSRQASK